MGLVPAEFEEDGGREGMVLDLVGEGYFVALIGMLAEYCTEGGNSAKDEVRERDGDRENVECGDRPPEGVLISSKSGSSTNSRDSISFTSSMRFDLSTIGDCMGVVAPLARPDILRIISILFFFIIPVAVLPFEGRGGNPHICLATLNSSLSFLRKGAFG